MEYSASDREMIHKLRNTVHVYGPRRWKVDHPHRRKLDRMHSQFLSAIVWGKIAIFSTAQVQDPTAFAQL